MTTPHVSLTAEEALDKEQNELNEIMVEFDRWVSGNPSLANNANTEYRGYQQKIKMLKLKIKEIRDLRDEYRNTLMVLSATSTIYKDPNIPHRFTKSKDNHLFTARETMKVGTRKNGLVSRGRSG